MDNLDNRLINLFNNLVWLILINFKHNSNNNNNLDLQDNNNSCQDNSNSLYQDNNNNLYLKISNNICNNINKINNFKECNIKDSNSKNDPKKKIIFL